MPELKNTDNKGGKLEGIKVDGLGKPDENAGYEEALVHEKKLPDLKDSAIDKPIYETYRIED